MDIPELKRLFGRRVQELRRQRKLTQEQLAESIGRSVDTISNIETGRLTTKLETLFKLADSLQVSLGELFEFGDLRSPIDRERAKAISALVRLVSSQETPVITEITRIAESAINLRRSG